MSMNAVEGLPPVGTPVTHEGTGWVIGQAVTIRQSQRLPIGATVWSTQAPERFFTRVGAGPGGWRRDDRINNQAIFWSGQKLRSLPDMRVETLAQFQQRFGDRVLEVTEGFSPEHTKVARQILADLGALPMLTGSVLAPDSKPPRGTVAMHGSPDQRTFTLFRYGRRGWVRTSGHFNDIGAAGAVTVVSAPGEKARPVVEGDSAAQIEAFKADVWERGQQAKQVHEWCSAYDHLLVEFGITDPNPHPDFSAFPVLVKGTENRDALPDGAVIGVDRGDWGIFRKVRGEWQRICGTRPLAAGTMNLLFDGQGALRIPNANALLGFLPTGTDIQTRRGFIYTKRADHTWTMRNRDRYPSDQFRLPVTVTRLP